MLNAVQCLRCFDVIESTHWHDFVACECGDVCIDGGPGPYRRRVFQTHAQWVEIY